jgi:elongation factor G
MTTPITRPVHNRNSSIHSLRNIGIAAHIDAGKTTLTERILFFAGVIHECGDVHDGNTKTDFDPIEKQKGITISAAAVPCTWTVVEENGRFKLFTGDEHRFNIIDTPGHVDFTAEVERSLRVLDGAIAVFCGVAGVQPQSETVWRQADRYEVPRIAFINKMDRTGANFDNVVAELQQKLHANAAAVLLPLGSEGSFRGQLDVINRKALLFAPDQSGEYSVEDIPAEYSAMVETRRAELISRLAEIDDEIAGHWLANLPITAELLHAVIRRQTVLNRFVPVIGGSAYKFVGVQSLMDAVVQYLPSPADAPSPAGHGEAAETGPDPDEPLVALAFKQVNDKLAGRLVFVRVYRGRMSKGDVIWNPRTQTSERVGRLVRVIADKREELAAVTAGEICAVVGLRRFTTGDTLCDPVNPIMLEPPSFPEPVVNETVG